MKKYITILRARINESEIKIFRDYVNNEVTICAFGGGCKTFTYDFTHQIFILPNGSKYLKPYINN